MNIERKRFAVNRKIAPTLSMEAFFQVVRSCGLHKVEIRNDMPSGNSLDQLSITAFGQLVEKYQIEVLTINALYPFNLLAQRQQVTKTAKEMLAVARDLAIKAIILCPFNETDRRTAEEKYEQTVDSIAYFSELFAQYGVTGLIEPLGFPVSSLRSFKLAEQCIAAANSNFKLTLDTFHHHLAGLSLSDYATTVDLQQVGLVHLSGVYSAKPTAQLSDEDRLMLAEGDILQSKAQVMAIETLGYRGDYSFEPFSSQLMNWSPEKIAEAINSSIDYLNR